MQLIKQWSTEETAAERSENFGGLKTHALIFYRLNIICIGCLRSNKWHLISYFWLRIVFCAWKKTPHVWIKACIVYCFLVCTDSKEWTFTCSFVVKNFLGCRKRNSAGDLVVKGSRHVAVMVKIQTLLMLTSVMLQRFCRASWQTLSGTYLGYVGCLKTGL